MRRGRRQGWMKRKGQGRMRREGHLCFDFCQSSRARLPVSVVSVAAVIVRPAVWKISCGQRR